MNNQTTTELDQEISLLDVLRFLKGAYKIILIFSVLGIAAAITYLVIAPREYEASAQIAMAQISSANNNNNNNNSPLGVNIEEPALLIARLSSPTSFTPEELVACGFEDKTGAASTFAKAIKLSTVKGVPNMVVLKTLGTSPATAKSCANTIFELTKKTQAQLVAPYIVETKMRLADIEDRLNRAKELISRTDKIGTAMGATNLLTRDEIRHLLNELADLKNILVSNQNRPTRLITPIYASDMPVAPKIFNVISIGLLGGFFAGLLIALSRQMIIRLKNK